MQLLSLRTQLSLTHWQDHQASLEAKYCPRVAAVSQKNTKNPSDLDLWPMTLKLSGFRAVVMMIHVPEKNSMPQNYNHVFLEARPTPLTIQVRNVQNFRSYLTQKQKKRNGSHYLINCWIQRNIPSLPWPACIQAMHHTLVILTYCILQTFNDNGNYHSIHQCCQHTQHKSFETTKL